MFYDSFNPHSQRKCFMTRTGFSSEWRWRDSNSWPPACKAGALPTELHPHLVMAILFNCLPMGLSGLEPPTSRLSGVRSNRLSYKPIQNAKHFNFWSGSHLLSHTVSSIVSSAVWVLTIVFGMCTGVSPKRIATRIVFTSWIHWKLLRNFCPIEVYRSAVIKFSLNNSTVK